MFYLTTSFCNNCNFFPCTILILSSNVCLLITSFCARDNNMLVHEGQKTKHHEMTHALMLQGLIVPPCTCTPGSRAR